MNAHPPGDAAPIAPLRSDYAPSVPKSDLRSEPTPECLLDRIPEMDRILRRRGYPPLVRERAIDRIIRAALPYFDKESSQNRQTDEERRAWLFGTLPIAARHEASREAPCLFLDPGELMAVASDEDDMAGERDRTIHAALDSLTKQQRIAVYSCIMLEITLEEVAEAMNCSVTNVARHRDQGMIRLRDKLSPLIPTKWTCAHRENRAFI